MERISPERVMRILQAHDVILSIEEANYLIDFSEAILKLADNIDELKILQKTVLNFEEACTYLSISQSHLYRLTAQRLIPHFCPHGKKLYFKRDEIDTWLLRNRRSSADEIDAAATDYIIRNRRK
mgnify:CR=1 FL=1